MDAGSLRILTMCTTDGRPVGVPTIGVFCRARACVVRYFRKIQSRFLSIQIRSKLA